MKTLLKLTFLLGVLGFMGCSQESELHKAMEDMGGTMKTMKKSDDAAALKAELTAFGAALERAKQQKVKPEDQSSFNEGMDKLSGKVGEALAVLNAGEIARAKQLVKEMHELQETYHEKLGVDDD